MPSVKHLAFERIAVTSELLRSEILLALLAVDMLPATYPVQGIGSKILVCSIVCANDITFSGSEKMRASLISR